MQLGLWMIALIFMFGFGYIMQFTSFTLEFGRALSGESSRTGYQNAITPPWFTNFAIAVYVGSFAIVVLMWWKFGWLSGLGAIVLILFGSSFAKLLLPKLAGSHYKNAVLSSMMRRYADFVRDGDSMRADAMRELLIRAGMDPDAMKSA
jgi:hypothetical protein